jgi:hypothetical protein
VHATERSEGEISESRNYLSAGHVLQQIEPLVPGRPALEGAAKDTNAEARCHQTGEETNSPARLVHLRDDRLRPLCGLDEIQPFARLEDVSIIECIEPLPVDLARV